MLDTMQHIKIDGESYLVEYDSTHPVILMGEDIGGLDSAFAYAIRNGNVDSPEYNEGATWLRISRL